MKKCIGLVVIIAALVLGSYYGMGIVTERTLKKNVTVINQSNGVSVEMKQYARGWFKSSALLDWQFHVPLRVVKNPDGSETTIPEQDYKLAMPLVIYHGPVIIEGSRVRFGLGYAHSELTIPDDYVQKFAAMFGDGSSKPMLKLRVFVNYLNNSRLHIVLPAFKLVLKQGGGQFQWDGMSTKISASSDLRKIDGNVTIDGASLTKNTMRATLGRIIGEYDLHRADSGLYLGKASVVLPSLVVMENEQSKLDVEQLNVQSSSDVINDLFSSYFKMSLLRVTALEKTYGPALLEIAIKNLDAETLARVNQQANKLQQGTENERQQALFALLPELPKLFSKGAQFEISTLHFVMPNGDVEGELSITLPKGDVGNPFQLLKKVDGHGKLRVPVTVLKGIITASIKQKLLSESNSPQAMVQPSQTTTAASSNVSSDNASSAGPENVNSSDNTKMAPQSSPSVPVPMTVEEINKAAEEQALLKLEGFVKAGLFVVNGTNYIIEFKLTDGQLTVNGNPFNPGMMQLQ